MKRTFIYTLIIISISFFSVLTSPHSVVAQTQQDSTQTEIASESPEDSNDAFGSGFNFLLIGLGGSFLIGGVVAGIAYLRSLDQTSY